LRLDRPDDTRAIHVSDGGIEFPCAGEIRILDTGDTLLYDRSTADALEIGPLPTARIIVIDLRQIAR
jgi:hypothetical protein